MKRCKCPHCGRVVEVDLETTVAAHMLPACRAWLDWSKQVTGTETAFPRLGKEKHDEKRSQVS